VSGAIRDAAQPSTEETGAVRTQLLHDALEKFWQLTLPKKMLCGT